MSFFRSGFRKLQLFPNFVNRELIQTAIKSGVVKSTFVQKAECFEALNRAFFAGHWHCGY